MINPRFKKITMDFDTYVDEKEDSFNNGQKFMQARCVYWITDHFGAKKLDDELISLMIKDFKKFTTLEETRVEHNPEI